MQWVSNSPKKIIDGIINHHSSNKDVFTKFLVMKTKYIHLNNKISNNL